MRWLLPGLACAQGLGIVLADRGLLGVATGATFGVVAAIAGCLLRDRRARAVAALGLALAAGVVALGARIEAARHSRPASARDRTIEGRVVQVRGHAENRSITLSQVAAVDGIPEAVAAGVLLWTSDPLAVPLDVGSAIRARVRIDAPRSLRNPGGRVQADRLTRLGIGAVARLVDPALIVRIPERDQSALVRLHVLRRRASQRLARTGEGGALLRALAFGDRSGIRREVREQFSRLGISHLLAVSGLHLGLLAGGAYAASRRILRRNAWLAARIDTRDLARGCAVAASCGYALLSGFGVPVRRALVLIVVVVAAALWGRRGTAHHSLAAAAVGVLALDPAALFSVGAQLSFAACGALLWSVRHDSLAAHGRRERLARALRASAVASAATAPLAAFHMGVAAPVAVAVNAFAIPWTALVLLPVSLAAAVLATLPESAVGGLALSFAERLAALTLHACEGMSRYAPQRLGGAPHPLALGVAVWVGLATLRARRAGSAAALASLCGVILWLAPPPSQAPPVPRLAVLDVGSGDAIVVQGRRAALLVDAGAAAPGRFDRGASTVVPALHALGVTRLDAVVATHADLDHRGGLPAVLRSFPVAELWIPNGSWEDPGFAALHAAALSAGVRVSERGRASPVVSFGDLRVETLWPPPEGSRRARNERSLVLRVGVDGQRVLLLGDLGAAERQLLDGLADARADVLVLPHHGSRGSASDALLAAVAAQVAIVSAPCPPRRSLPHADALARTRRSGASLWWTGRDGAVLVGLRSPLVVVPYAGRRDCGELRPSLEAGQPALSVPAKPLTSGRQTNRIGGR